MAGIRPHVIGGYRILCRDETADVFTAMEGMVDVGVGGTTSGGVDKFVGRLYTYR